MTQIVETTRPKRNAPPSSDIERISLEDVSEADWLRLRHPFIGSSEAPILMGEGYSGQTLWDLWQKKRKPEPPADSNDVPLRMWLGKEVQGIIAKAAERETGWRLEPNHELVVDHKSRMAATVDFRLHGLEGMGVVETKARDYFSFKERYTEFDACPYDLIQLSQQMMLEPEAVFGAIVVLVGMQKLVRYTYKREQLAGMMVDIRKRTQGFWQSIDQGIEPPILDADVPAYVSAHFEQMITDPEDPADLEGMDDMLKRYGKMHTAKNAAEKICKSLKPKVIEAMQGEDGQLRRFGFSEDYLVDMQIASIAERTTTTKAHNRVTLKIHPREVAE